MFSVKLVARPDARMVEVPLEIEAELPREFDGAALLASSGLPRKVKIKAQRDELKLSTAYRADQLMADIVRTVLRGTPQDAARVQEATRAFIRTVRERRQDGATLVVSSNGRGKIEVLEQLPERAPKSRPAPVSEPPLGRPASQVTLADRLAAVEKRLGELESGFASMAASNAEERLSQLEERFTTLQSRTDLAGPMIEAHAGGPATMELSRTPGAPRRTTAVEAFAVGLRRELRARVTEQLQHAERATGICDRAAALAAEAESLLGAPHDGTAQRLRLTAATAAARMKGLSRVAEEIDLYQPADLGIAAQLVSRLEDGPAQLDTPDPATPLQLQAEALVRAARGPDAADRANWLRRAAALCGWTLIEPEVGGGVQPDLAQSVQGGGGGSSVVAVAAPGLRRNDGSVLVRARVLASVAETADEEVEVLATSGGGDNDFAAAPRSAPAHPGTPAGAPDAAERESGAEGTSGSARPSGPAGTSDAEPSRVTGAAAAGESMETRGLPKSKDTRDLSGAPEAAVAAGSSNLLHSPSGPDSPATVAERDSATAHDSPETATAHDSGETAPESEPAVSERPAPADARDSPVSEPPGAAKPELGQDTSLGLAVAPGEPGSPHASDALERHGAGPGDASVAHDAGATSARPADAAPFGNLAGSGDISPDEAAAAAAARWPTVAGKEAPVDAALAAQTTLATESEAIIDADWANVARGPDAFHQPAKPALPPPPPVEEDNYEVSDADVEEILDPDPTR